MSETAELTMDHENKVLDSLDTSEVISRFSEVRKNREFLRYEYQQHGIQRKLENLFRESDVDVPKYTNPKILDLACGSCPVAEGITDFFMGNQYSRDNIRNGLYVGVELNTPALLRSALIIEPGHRDIYKHLSFVVHFRIC